MVLRNHRFHSFFKHAAQAFLRDRAPVFKRIPGVFALLRDRAVPGPTGPRTAHDAVRVAFGVFCAILLFGTFVLFKGCRAHGRGGNPGPAGLSNFWRPGGWIPGEGGHGKRGSALYGRWNLRKDAKRAETPLAPGISGSAERMERDEDA